MNVGMIVGIGPAATDYYYRTIIRKMSDSGHDLNMMMAHADTSTLLRNQSANNIQAQLDIYMHLTDKIAKAGVEAVAVTSIAGHFCIDEFISACPIPVINMLDCVKQEITNKGYKRVGLLGTRMVMETAFYSKLGFIEVVAPKPDILSAVHEAYSVMTVAGTVTEQQKQVFLSAGKSLIEDEGCECVLLAGTDFLLVYTDDFDSGYPIIDCAKLHALEIVEWSKKS
jgi:aspartate racemase